MTRWLYKIEWMDGKTSDYITTRRAGVPAASNMLTIYVNPHGHDQRYDEIGIPLDNVRQWSLTEMR